MLKKHLKASARFTTTFTLLATALQALSAHTHELTSEQSLTSDSTESCHNHIAGRDSADLHAPISVMGDHTHGQGEWMLSYRYMYMDMSGMRTGSDSISSTQVFNENYIVSPTDMTMEMHMFGLMYAPTDWLTLMAMINYRESEMDHEIFAGAAPLIALNNGSRTFTTRSSGFGDVKLTGLFSLLKDKTQSLHANFGISLPTGSIGEQDIVPGPGGGRINRQLPAPMQLGSGTVDWHPALTYSRYHDSYSWGSQVGGIVRFGRNHHEYRLGNEFNAKFWTARNLSSWVSVSAKVGYRYAEEMSGQQTDLLLAPPFAPTRRTVTTAFSENYGGETADIAIGANFIIPSGTLKGNRIAIELSAPFWQNLNGVQLETDYTLTAGWQFAW